MLKNQEGYDVPEVPEVPKIEDKPVPEVEPVAAPANKDDQIKKENDKIEAAEPKSEDKPAANDQAPADSEIPAAGSE